VTAACTLRQEVRTLLRAPAARAAWAALAEAGPWGENDPRPLYRLLGSHRLLAPSWPRAFGGRDLPMADAAVVVDEMIAAGVPDTLHTLSVQICGNFLLGAGTPAHRAALLPALAAGSRFCTVLYTEPGAGSDLAALETEARQDTGGTWRVSGHKLFSVRTRLADIGLVAARTSREQARYRGLTLFLVPLTAPGVTIGKLGSLADEAFADVHLDNVPVDAASVVGEVGEAWALITEALALERTGTDHAAKAAAWLSAAVTSLRGTGDTGAWRERAGQLRTRTAAAQAMSRRCVGELGRGSLSPVLAAATKLWCSETAREVAEWAGEALGEASLWPAGQPGAVADGRLEAAYREAPGLVISAGTSEMMRELVAGAGLTAALHEQHSGLLADLRAAVRAAVESDSGQKSRVPTTETSVAGTAARENHTADTAARETHAAGAAVPGTGVAGTAARENHTAGLTADETRAAGAAVPGTGVAGTAARETQTAGTAALGAGAAEAAAAGTCWRELAGLGLFRLGADAAAGGLGLGPVALIAACEEIGRCGYDGGVLDTLTVAAALAGAGPAHPCWPRLPALLDGSARGAIVLPGRPSRPLTDPGPGGLLLVGHASRPGGIPAGWSLLAADAPGVARQVRRTMAGEVSTLELDAGTGGHALSDGDETLLAGDLLRRSAWLTGAILACLTATEQRARSRRQFGHALADNQAVAHRLADLAVGAEALRTLLYGEAARGDAAGLAGPAGLLAESGRLARRAAAVGVHLHGAAGMLAGSPVERAFRKIPLVIAGGLPPALLDQLATGGPAPA
jgi:alkylation response protein AidB-like acyl-CoA dehydrogenase